MALANPATKVDVSAALTALEPPGVDQYCIAFGPGAAQFYATPNGYSTAQLPRKVVDDLLDGQIKKVLHATFGSGANSFFFTYEMKDGTVAHRAGKAIPTTLKSFVKRVSTESEEVASSLRVQLGANRSFVAWAGLRWISRGIPSTLRNTLHGLSSIDLDDAGGSQGIIRFAVLENVVWHDNGSYYIKGATTQRWGFQDAAAEAWEQLWGRHHQHKQTEIQLAYVAINPHSPSGGTFAFFKKALVGQDPEFALRFEPEETIFRLYAKQAPPGVPLLDPRASGYRESVPDGPVLEEKARGYSQMVNVPKKGGCLQVFQWAISKRTGRSHPMDSWELDMKKGERVKILKYIGKDWFFVENRRSQQGWAHRTFLDFQEMIPHVDPREAYTRFTTDIEKTLKTGNIHAFPDMSRYMNACAKDSCSSLKKDTHRLGICIHDLHELLRGSAPGGQYTLEILKTERNKWHPDKFARYCHPDQRSALRKKAEALFVLFGVLMDMLENPPAPEPAV